MRGISTGDFQEALAALLGQNAPNLSPAVISRLTAEWQGEYERWQKRDLSARQYVYVWADGVFLQARMEDHGECMLVLIGATPEGKKELIGFQVDWSGRSGMRCRPARTIDDAQRQFRLRWAESGGPPVLAPSHRSFGSRLIEHSFVSQLQGKANLAFEASGVVCTLDVPSAVVKPLQ